jgi:GNAT superfamily N-acetyltransferase
MQRASVGASSTQPSAGRPGAWKTAFVTASDQLSLRWLTDPVDGTPALREALTICWRDVANNGGAVGFAELLPVTEDDVAPVVDEILDGLHPRLSRLLVGTQDGDVAGWLVLTGNANPVTAHWGRVARLQTSVTARGTGVAGALMTELHRCAREDLGLDSLRLEARGGWGLEAFYEKFGWVVVGAWPGALQFTQHGRRDEVLMSTDLTRGS